MCLIKRDSVGDPNGAIKEQSPHSAGSPLREMDDTWGQCGQQESLSNRMTNIS